MAARTLRVLSLCAGGGSKCVFVFIGSDGNRSMNSPCDFWQGSCMTSGYGQRSFQGRNRPAHLVEWLLAGRDIPNGFVLDHQCHNEDKNCRGGPSCIHRRCKNLDHLRVVTKKENVLAGRAGHRDFCPKGHALSGCNLIVNRNGSHRCRECNKAHQRNYRLALAARMGGLE